MDTKKLAVFQEAIKNGSLKKTAEKLNYTQSGLIYMMNSLEDEFGIHLLNRTTKGIELTQEGILLEPYIKKIVDCEEELTKVIADIHKEGTKKIRIGAYPIYACHYLPTIMKSFLVDNPENEITIRVATADNLSKMLEEDEVDLAVGEKGLIKNTDWIFLMKYEIYAALPQTIKLADDVEAVTYDLLKDYPLLFSSYNKVSEHVEEMLGTGKEKPYKINVASEDGSALLSMVEEGLGIAFLSSLYLRECPDTVRMLPLDPHITRELGVILKPEKKKSVQIKKFIEYLQKQQY